MGNPDYYEILGVGEDADQKTIKDAYRELAFEYHPDRNTDNPAAADKMKQVNEAYAVLSNPARRADYDRLRRHYSPADAYSRFRQDYSDQDIFAGTDIKRVFDELAKSFGFRSFDDIVREAHNAGGRSFEFHRSGFSGRGFFFFGAFGFGSFPFKMLGHLGRRLLQGGAAGDTLAMAGQHLYDTIQISADLAANGGPYAYFHRWQKKKLVVQIPAGMRHNQSIRLAGLGEPGSGQGRPGDLFLRIDTRGSLVQRLRNLLPF